MRTVRIFDSITIVAQCVVEDLVVVRDVMLLTCMLLSAFALIALTCFHGSLQYACVEPCEIASNGDICVADNDVLPAGAVHSPETSGGLLDCPVTLQCAASADAKIVDSCAKFASPRPIGGYMDPQGLRSFDNFLSALISMVVHMSADGGMQDYPQALQDAKATSDWLAWPFFAVAAVVLGLVAMNLMLAVCVSALSSVNEIMQEKEKKLARAARAEAAIAARAQPQQDVGSPRTQKILEEVERKLNTVKANVPMPKVGQWRPSCARFALPITFG